MDIGLGLLYYLPDIFIIKDKKGEIMYRPEGWKETHKRLFPEWNTQYCDTRYEAGADAFYEALKDGAKIPDGNGGSYRLVHYLKPVRAKFETAFSPEEEE